MILSNVPSCSTLELIIQNGTNHHTYGVQVQVIYIYFRIHNSIEGPESFKCVNKPLERDSSRPLLHVYISLFHQNKKYTNVITEHHRCVSVDTRARC